MEMNVFPVEGGKIQDQSCHAIQEVKRVESQLSYFRKMVSKAEGQANQAARWGWLAYPMRRRRKGRKSKHLRNLKQQKTRLKEPHMATECATLGLGVGESFHPP